MKQRRRGREREGEGGRGSEREGEGSQRKKIDVRKIRIIVGEKYIIDFRLMLEKRGFQFSLELIWQSWAIWGTNCG